MKRRDGCGTRLLPCAGVQSESEEDADFHSVDRTFNMTCGVWEDTGPGEVQVITPDTYYALALSINPFDFSCVCVDPGGRDLRVRPDPVTCGAFQHILHP